MKERARDILERVRAMDVSGFPRKSSFTHASWLTSTDMGVLLESDPDGAQCYCVIDPLQNGLAVARDGAGYTVGMKHDDKNVVLAMDRMQGDVDVWKAPHEFESAAEAIEYVCSLVEKYVFDA